MRRCVSAWIAASCLRGSAWRIGRSTIQDDTRFPGTPRSASLRIETGDDTRKRSLSGRTWRPRRKVRTAPVTVASTTSLTVQASALRIARVSAPVSMRSEAERSVPGNRVSSWLVELPIRQSDPRKQLAAIHAETQRLKSSQNALGVELLMSAAEWAPAGIVSLGARMASGSFNSIVTNVPGPQHPLYMLGARLRAMIPQVPLLENLGLCMALLSYDGQMHWGFTADYELVPDLSLFVEAVESSFAELARIAGVEPAGATRECTRGAEPLVH